VLMLVVHRHRRSILAVGARKVVLIFLMGYLLSSYLRRLRGGVGWQVTGCTRNKRGLVQRLAEGGAKDGVGGGGGGGGGEAGRACAQEVGGQTVRKV
jgi:hypothetical protein